MPPPARIRMTCESATYSAVACCPGFAKLNDLMKFGVSTPSLKRIGRVGPKEIVGVGVELCRYSALGCDNGESETVARDQMGSRG